MRLRGRICPPEKHETLIGFSDSISLFHRNRQSSTVKMGLVSAVGGRCYPAPAVSAPANKHPDPLSFRGKLPQFSSFSCLGRLWIRGDLLGRRGLVRLRLPFSITHHSLFSFIPVLVSPPHLCLFTCLYPSCLCVHVCRSLLPALSPSSTPSFQALTCRYGFRKVLLHSKSFPNMSFNGRFVLQKHKR